MDKSKVATLEGNEIADYARTSLPESRWGDTWELIKTNFVKLIIINVLTLVCFVPAIVIMYFRTSQLAGMGVAYPMSGAASLSQISPGTLGQAELLTLNTDLIWFGILIAAGFIAAIGLAGASYSIKKLINTHGNWVFKDFFRGIKRCYINTAFCVMLFMTFLYGTVLVCDWAHLEMARGGNVAGSVTAEVFIIIATVIVAVYAMWLLAVGNSYKVKLRYLFKNSFVLMFGTILQTVFMLGFAFIPLWITLIPVQFFTVVGYILFLFFGFSFILVCWFAFTQWVFDAFVEPAIVNEKEAAKAKMTPEEREKAKQEEERDAARAILAAGRSELIGKPIKPIEENVSIPVIGVVYSREDIKRASADRGAMNDGIKEYYEEHKNDTRYVVYEKMFAEREKALAAENKKGKNKKKKISSQNLLQ